MHHLSPETAIWIILLVIGVISSVVSNARKAVRAARSRARVTPAHGIMAQAMATPVQAPVEIPQPVVAVPVASPPIIVQSARIKAAQTRPAAPAPVPTHGTPVFRGMFERGNLVRAIVAAEVLGPPKALQEQSIWSPRHSEPST